MSPDDIRELIDLLPSLQADGWLDLLLQRDGALPPRLLPLVALLPVHVSDALAEMKSHLPVLDQLVPALNATGQHRCWAERPMRQVQRVANALLAGQDLPSNDKPESLGTGADTAEFSQAAQHHLAQAMGIAAQWLQAASHQGAQPDLVGGRAAWGGWLPANQLGPACTLPIALVDEALESGVPAELTLCLVHQPGARLCLVPMPASALLLRLDADWDETLADLREQLLSRLLPDQGLALHDTAIAWDVHRPDGGPLGLLAGGSAGASFALGALWLLRAAAPPDWRHELLRLEPRHLRQSALSATLGPGFSLGRVGGVDAKSQALLPLAAALASQQRGELLELGVSADQPLPVMAAGRPAAGAVPLKPLADLWAAVQHLAQRADQLTDQQLALWQALIEPGEGPPDLAAGLLKAVSEQPALSLRQYLLRCWATCGRAMHERLHQRFVALDVVPLEVKADALGDRKPLLQQGAGPFPSLQHMLQQHDNTLVQQGYLLRGLPGSGKSTLLRHHLQRAARRLLQQEAGTFRPTPADAGRPPPHEVPVFLALNTLDEDLPQAALPAWLRGQLLAAGPPELLGLLAGRGSWAQERHLRARVLLDGLNELRVPQASQRAQRAGQVVAALSTLMHGQLPALLSIRSSHVAELGSFDVLQVDVQDWTQQHITDYLGQCFPGQAEARLAELAKVKGALALCQRPMHLAAQCELMASGYAAPPGDRAALYQAWLWQRLRRALGRESGHENQRVPHACWTESGPDHPDEVLLTAADRAAIFNDEAWHKGPLRPLPLQGQLLRSLMRQALDQWYAEAEGGMAAGERTAAPQPWPQVARWLHRPATPPVPGASDSADPGKTLRQRFGEAARDLGLVGLDDGFTDWQFEHQSWGEYLASCQLLADDPPASDRLLQRLRAPALPFDSDEAEIAALGQTAASAWQAVPQDLWDDLAKDGLSVRWEDYVNSKFDRPARDAAELESMAQIQRQRRAADFNDGTLWIEVSEDVQWCRANLTQWGDSWGVGDALGLGREDWRDPQKAGAAGWQFLVQQRLDPIFRAALWDWLRPHLSEKALADLQRQQGRLDAPPDADGAEVLGLALLGLAPARLQAWLQALLVADAATAGPQAPGPGMANSEAPTGPLWPALAGVLPALQARLEPGGAWGENAAPSTPDAARPPPQPLLQHLRRVLLLTALDGGAASLAGVRASGMLQLLDAPPPVPVPPDLQAAWQGLRATAFQGPGQRLRRRLQAGLVLGGLGDNLRYQFCADGLPSPGLRPHPALWAPVGPQQPRRRGRFGIGGGPFGDEQPGWTAHLPGFLACRLPLTVGEWLWFQRSPQGRQWQWAQAADADFNNPLQPITGVTWRAMLAYAEWADGLQPTQGAKPGANTKRPRLALPTELQWEAAARGPLPGLLWRLCKGLLSVLRRQPADAPKHSPPPATRFNHANTRWLRPSPVGCFSRGITALGLADTQGNVWEFCASALTDEQRLRGWRKLPDRDQAGVPAAAGDDRDRSLRGGAFDVTSAQCRPSCRNRNLPGYHYYYIGVRLVRLWPPHSEP